MKKIVISISDGMVERNLLKVGFLDDLLKREDCQIYILSSDKNIHDHIRNRYNFPNLEFIYEPYALKKYDAFCALIGQNSIHTNTLKENQYKYWKGVGGRENTSLLLFFIFRIFWYLGMFKFWRAIVRFLYKINPHHYGKGILKKIKPDIVFVPSINPTDYKLVAEAKRQKILVVQMIKSWDNLTSKTFLGTHADYLVVHNEVMRDEAIKLNDFPENKIFVSGIPQFDFLIKNKDKLEIKRVNFYGKMGVDPEKKVILYSASGSWLSPNDQDFILMIVRAIESGRLPKNIHIQLRLHPKYENDISKIIGSKWVTIERPFSYIGNNFRNWVFNEKDIIHWYNSIWHSAMVINVASTMSIDAAVLGRPAICPTFDGYQRLPYKKSIARYYDREHYKKLIETKGVRLANNEEELISAVDCYLKDENKDANERKSLVKQQCYKLDGRSSLRIIDFLMKSMEN